MIVADAALSRLKPRLSVLAWHSMNAVKLFLAADGSLFEAFARHLSSRSAWLMLDIGALRESRVPHLSGPQAG